MVKRGITLSQERRRLSLRPLVRRKKVRHLNQLAGVIMVEIWCFYQMIMSLTEGRLHTEMKL